MNLELIIVIVAAVAVVGLVGLSLSIREMPGDRPRVDQAYPRTSLAGAKDVVDRSIGVFLIRRVSGRPTTRRRGPDAPTTPLTKDEVAYRTGVLDAPIPAEIDVPVPPAKGRRSATAAAARAGATQASGMRNGAGRTTSPRTPARSATAPMAVSSVSATDRSGRRVVAGPAGPAAPRERLVRDAGIALVGLAAFALVAIFAFPGSAGQPTGSRLAVVQASESDATTPDPTDTPPIESATASTSSDDTPLPSDAATPTPTPEPTPPATGSPAPTPGPTPAPTPTPKATPKPTPRPTATPRPTPTPTPTPKPTATPTPNPTASPTPVPVHAKIEVSASCTAAGGSISFTASNSTGETSYAWVFDDGSSSSSANPSHVFSGSQAIYNIILTVNGPGGQDSTSTEIHVPC
jgi:hypothetical protein